MRPGAAALAAWFVCLTFSPALCAATAKKKATGTSTSKKRKAPPKPPRTTAEERAEAEAFVQSHIAEAGEAGIQNAAAMVPFYERLYQSETAAKSGGLAQTVRVLQFGDSHTASDDWAGALRELYQKRFGNGGPGFTHAGRPFLGYRRFDSRATMSKGWKAEGLRDRDGDGMNGLSGVSLIATKAGETITLEADGTLVEVFYLQQPGGGSFTVEDAGAVLETVDTGSGTGAGYLNRALSPGTHSLTLRTQGGRPVRIFGWVLENRGGITWETLGINGAQADLLLSWDAALLKSQLERRDPALIVLAYGTNEARRAEWSLAEYQQQLAVVLGRLREAAPLASILVIGAPDQMIRKGRTWTSPETVGEVLAAQRKASLGLGCAFWNLRAAMGGRGSMKQWVQAGLGQGDFVHLTAGGYRLLGEALFSLTMAQYEIFLAVRREGLGTQAKHGSQSNHP